MFFFSFKQYQNKRKSYGIKVRWHLKLDSYITVFLTTCHATCWIMCKVWWWSKMELKYLPESIIAFATRKWTVQQLHFIIDVHKNSLNWFTINLIMMLKSESGDNINFQTQDLVVCDDRVVQLSIIAVKLTLALSDTIRVEKQSNTHSWLMNFWC